MTKEETKRILKAKIGLKAVCELESDEERQLVWELIEKDDKYGWHDLRKNPNDLPKEDLFFKNILATDGTYYMTDCSIYVDDEMGCISAESESVIMYKVIAWREIEPFEVEEE